MKSSEHIFTGTDLHDTAKRLLLDHLESAQPQVIGPPSETDSAPMKPTSEPTAGLRDEIPSVSTPLIVSRRALLGLPPVSEADEVHSLQTAKQGRKLLLPLAVVLGGVGAFMFSQDNSSNEPERIINSVRQAPTVSVTSTTSTTLSTPETTVVIVPPEVTTTTMQQAPETTQPEAPIVPETVPPTLAPETVPPVVETVPPAETVPPETAPPTTVDVYAGVDCTAASTVIIRGMTPSELADHCGISIERLQQYNPRIDLLTEFITGRTLNLKQQATTQSSVGQLAKNCPEWFGVRRVIPVGFTVYGYLESIGIENPNSIIQGTSMLRDYGLDEVVAGTSQCLPTPSALAVRYNV